MSAALFGRRLHLFTFVVHCLPKIEHSSQAKSDLEPWRFAMIVTEHLQDDRTSRNNGHRQMAGSGIRPKERPKVAGPLHAVVKTPK